MTVAECDIKGFFDCVDHSIAIDSLHSLIAEAAQKLNIYVDGRAVKMFESYLASYSFSESVLDEASAALKARDPRFSFKWPKPDLERLHGVELDSIKIGVPQGGAHSCLIANVILHRADRAIAKYANRQAKALTYLRYCDDTIILSRHHAVCEEAFRVYQETLERLRLPIHAPEPVISYDKAFFERKSNNPYRWHHQKPNEASVPWIQFVGYQIRWDGFVRVRRRSLVKHKAKIVASVDEVLKVVRPKKKKQDELPNVAAKKSRGQILFRLTQRLLSMSIGQPRLGAESDEIQPMCWASGFKALRGKAVHPNALQELDRHREHQVRRLRRALSSIEAPDSSEKYPELDLPPYLGYPFSYTGQFWSRPKKRSNRSSSPRHP